MMIEDVFISEGVAPIVCCGKLQQKKEREAGPKALGRTAWFCLTPGRTKGSQYRPTSASFDTHVPFTCQFLSPYLPFPYA